MVCGKVSYSTRNEAINSIKGIHKDNRSSRSRQQPKRSYFCDECQSWHLSSNRKKPIQVKASNDEVISIKVKVSDKPLHIKNFTSKRK